MSRGSRMPRSTRPRTASAGAASLGAGRGTGWGGIIPVAGLCVIALAAGLVAFSGRGGAETRSSATCLTDAAPGRFGTWDAFFRRYPFDDAFLKARIREANGDAPGPVVLVPLEAGASCGRAAAAD